VSTKTATIRELRTAFRAIKRRLEEHGEIVITDRGKPAYVIKSLPAPSKQPTPLPNYFDRLLKRQPKAFTAAETHLFWDTERR